MICRSHYTLDGRTNIINYLFQIFFFVSSHLNRLDWNGVFVEIISERSPGHGISGRTPGVQGETCSSTDDECRRFAGIMQTHQFGSPLCIYSVSEKDSSCIAPKNQVDGESGVKIQFKCRSSDSGEHQSIGEFCPSCKRDINISFPVRNFFMVAIACLDEDRSRGLLPCE